VLELLCTLQVDYIHKLASLTTVFEIQMKLGTLQGIGVQAEIQQNIVIDCQFCEEAIRIFLRL